LKVIKPGIRHRIYLNGYTISRPPSSVVQGEPQVAEDARRYRDGELVITRLYPYSGGPDSITKRSWSITWDYICGLDLAHLNALIAVRGVIDFCPWTDEAEAFWILPGFPLAGTLQRRTALSVVPSAQYPTPTAATDFATHVYSWNTSTLAWDEHVTVVLGSVTSTYRTPWSLTAPPAGWGGAAQGLVLYTPVYRVRVAASQPSYPGPAAENVMLRLEE